MDVGAGPASPADSAATSPSASQELPTDGGSRLAKYLENSRKVVHTCQHSRSLMHPQHTVHGMFIGDVSCSSVVAMRAVDAKMQLPRLQVLRFFCVWDDRASLLGDRRPYRLHYFLEDDTIEVLEVLWPLNPNLISRDALCMSACISSCMQGADANCKTKRCCSRRCRPSVQTTYLLTDMPACARCMRPTQGGTPSPSSCAAASCPR